MTAMPLLEPIVKISSFEVIVCDSTLLLNLSEIKNKGEMKNLKK
jgi:hypothetical protein